MVELKPLDVVLAAMAATLEPAPWTIAAMADALGVSGSQVFLAAQRAGAVGFLFSERAGRRVLYRVHRAALVEFLTHGIRYVFVPERGRLTRGVATSHAAPILADHFRAADAALVWPHPHGTARGESFEPLHRCVPAAALRHARFYDVMALIDALRAGRARDRAIAADLLPRSLGDDAS
ncbi:MAG: hypothetical protein KBG48_10505 [Kofleriaceae bacterium]|jgi:hypothetical protein|nr:hypothetical protein [Kofleriaceae bacterium]MBP9167811.1 hypothetical protein [Kofleriaceae bacterium]MBP9862432.1 hypothetical protein [Kofleriaceae bacterium]